MDVDLDKNALNTIHGERNYNKAICYWLGFLKGVLASKDVTSFERPQHNPYFSKTLENMPLVLFDKI